MSRFTIHTIDTAPADSRAALEALRQEVGFLPNLAATMAESPTLIESFTTLRKILGHSSFTPVERETIALSVSFENDCTYCMAAHSTFAKMSGISEPALEALRVGGNPPDERLGALATYTRHVIDHARLRHGRSDAGLPRRRLHAGASARRDRRGRAHDDRELRS